MPTTIPEEVPRLLEVVVRRRYCAVESGQPEIENLREAINREKDVLWLQIPVDDSARVGGCQAGRQIAAEPHSGVDS